ncbi:polar amino acid transport system substrate-binding protein [Duganella sp. CF458]|uniref:substrate-binding periplasmic protein n=1 Tax=Duganella sp. CF458 TaxID=1884368 RepID=UPI0008EB20A3|nr:transporter substrate-binding domain-containing protein [Duganella sp. CF458]SFG65080.1 polar amino acid transport system substrate-binding protein [Duganella sp. CF458]
MSARVHSFLRQLLAALPLAVAALPSHADCSRDIVVPVSTTGVSVIVGNGTFSGIYPEIFRSLGPRAGCHFTFTSVPRARQELLFESGKADLLVPATRTAARDVNGIFVPMVGHRAVLISLQSPRPQIANAQDLLDRRDLRVAIVRGYDYGDAYQAIVRELARQGRLFTEVEPSAIARLLYVGAVDITIMGPTILAGSINRDTRVNGMLDRLRMEAIPELPWQQTGVYVSRSSLNPDDRAVLLELLERAAKSNIVMEGFQRYHRPEILAESVRPR